MIIILIVSSTYLAFTVQIHVRSSTSGLTSWSGSTTCN
jgi:hypothetical protein